MTSLSPHLCCSWMVAVKLDTLSFICNSFSSQPQQHHRHRTSVFETRQKEGVPVFLASFTSPKISQRLLMWQKSKCFSSLGDLFLQTRSIVWLPNFIFSWSGNVLSRFSGESHWRLEGCDHFGWNLAMAFGPIAGHFDCSYSICPASWLHYMHSWSTMLDTVIKLKESPEFTQFSQKSIPINWIGNLWKHLKVKNTQ